MDMGGGNHQFGVPVLQVEQPLSQVGLVMVVDEG
jgi:hypothetical protein